METNIKDPNVALKDPTYAPIMQFLMDIKK